MIPFIALKSFSFGPLTIQVWGLMVALGILVGAWLGARAAKKRGLDGGVVWDAAAWIVVGAMVVGRLFHVALYDPATYLADPFQVVAVWKGGMSMFGGLVGAAAAGLGYLQYKRLPLLAYADAMMAGLPLGIGIGRIGCFLIHDHPGTLTHIVLGVRYPDGSVRHDLGLYESIYGFALALVFFAMSRRHVRPPSYAIVFLATYGAFRFFADMLRAVDARYFGLTPGQYASAACVAIAIGLAIRERRRRVQ